ncbi:hypothetical protein [Fretibacter rubidus]|uniref:hypothetical protein n=1 Tax=Fretibacter rubidus TaxID=570162 RepID=UPI00352AE074
MNTKIKITTALAAAALMSACATQRPALSGQDANFGVSNRANIAAHAVTPDPKLKADTYIPANRARVRAAREAYEKGEVIEPKIPE